MKPFKCEQCGKKFKFQGWLKQHQKATGHGSYDDLPNTVGQKTAIEVNLIVQYRDQLVEEARAIDTMLEKLREVASI